jgi:hypothetical protein
MTCSAENHYRPAGPIERSRPQFYEVSYPEAPHRSTALAESTMRVNLVLNAVYSSLVQLFPRIYRRIWEKDPLPRASSNHER